MPTEPEHDVFLCHNSQDKRAVKEIAERLKARGIRPWLDEWQLRPGLPWQRALEKQIRAIGSAAVFVGESGFGPWHNLELEGFLRQFVKRSCPVIPVILSTCPKRPELPVFLEGMTWVDFRKQDPDPLKQLIWGITGKQPVDESTDGSSVSSEQSSITDGMLAPSRAQMVREVIQRLGTDQAGVALLEPLGFGARRVVDRVVNVLREPTRPELVVRLVPDRRTTDEARLYRALFRDLRRGLEEMVAKPLPSAWSQAFPAVSTAPDEESFEVALEEMLDGPVAAEGRCLVLLVEGLSRVGEDHLLSWAYLISRLTGNYPLKVLAWGAQELFDLCTGYTDLCDSSPFQRLARLELGCLTHGEVRELLAERLGDPSGSALLYQTIGGHPALLEELLQVARDDLRRRDRDRLRARALASPHLRSLRRRVEREERTLEALRAALKGDFKRHYTVGEERLRWLGILEEKSPATWRWTIPIFKEWAMQWLG